MAWTALRPAFAASSNIARRANSPHRLSDFSAVALSKNTTPISVPGYRYSFGVTARQAITDRISVFGAFERTIREADNPVFETKDYAGRVNIDYSLGQHGVLYAGGEYREGDAVTTVDSTSLFYLEISDVSTLDDAYHNLSLEASRYEAETWLFNLGFNWPLGPRDAIDFSWRYASSSPSNALDDNVADDTGSTSYTSNQLSVTYLMRF